MRGSVSKDTVVVQLGGEQIDHRKETKDIRVPTYTFSHQLC